MLRATPVGLPEGPGLGQGGEEGTADLEHWNYDTFRARYRNWWIEPSMVSFRLAPDGNVSAVDLGDGKVLARVPVAKPSMSGGQ